MTVVVPSYNHGSYIKEAIHSIVSQSYKNIELIIIDDGSSDNSIDVISSLSSVCLARFTRFEFRARENKGLSSTLNEALSWARGEYFSPIASDDVMLPNKTSMQVSFLEKNPHCAGVFGLVHTLHDSGDEFLVVEAAAGTEKKIYGFKEVFLHRHSLPAPTQMLRRNCLIDIGGYNPSIVIDDWYMWLLITKADDKKLALLKTVVCFYRRHAGNSSSNIDFMHIGRLQVVKEYTGRRFYSLAEANCFLASANELLNVSKVDSVKYFLKGFIISPLYVFQVRVFKYFFQLLRGLV
ncbi:glycosyltransferase family A protein [Phytopseudomonas seleniipraecipitans]|uniref:glycosyltransferase family A protein n=1 Tax=Phytopseudomonas seleniipraecipitans TaxID=640205 RepID=UPI001428B01D|nr:glycosyltransferase family 2 protein [Pseudomonas seleniipraecipitans]